VRRHPAIPRLVDDDAHQPGTKGRAGAKPTKGVKRLDERLLRGILGFRRFPSDLIGGSKRQLLISLDELIVGPGVATSGPVDEFGVLQRRAPRPLSSLLIQRSTPTGSQVLGTIRRAQL